MRGMIVIWSGSVATIPDGWVQCNGANGTPDLRDKFVMAAGVTFAPGAVGGGNTHTHTIAGSGHSHIVGPGAFVQGGAFFDALTSVVPVTGVTNPKNNIPQYHALLYIMKT